MNSTPQSLAPDRCRRASRLLIPMLLLTSVAGCMGDNHYKSGAPQASERSALGEIERVLQKANAAWARDDLDGFLRYYDPDVVYITDASLLKGVGPLRSMLSTNYGLGTGTGRSQSRLSFEILEFQLLDPNHAIVSGRFHVDSPGDKAGGASGMAMLVFRKSADGWRVLADRGD